MATGNRNVEELFRSQYLMRCCLASLKEVHLLGEQRAYLKEIGVLVDTLVNLRKSAQVIRENSSPVTLGCGVSSMPRCFELKGQPCT